MATFGGYAGAGTVGIDSSRSTLRHPSRKATVGWSLNVPAFDDAGLSIIADGADSWPR